MSLKELVNQSLKKVKESLFMPTNYSTQLSVEDLINAESEVGRTLFGPIPYGHQREFFESKKNVWIWHESWKDNLGYINNMTVRYEVRPTGVFKKINRGDYKKIEGSELDNFRDAARTYLNLVKEKIYN